MTKTKVYHEFGPVYDGNSRILILGSIPSPRSREYGFYYCHPQNRFWKVISAVLQTELPAALEEKRAFLVRHHIAMWDVLESCEIKGADDSSIANPKPNQLRLILDAADIRAIFTTGKKATDLYRRLCLTNTGRESISLPSTSPANCRNQTLESLTEAYRVILDYLL